MTTTPSYREQNMAQRIVAQLNDKRRQQHEEEPPVNWAVVEDIVARTFRDQLIDVLAESIHTEIQVIQDENKVWGEGLQSPAQRHEKALVSAQEKPRTFHDRFESLRYSDELQHRVLYNAESDSVVFERYVPYSDQDFNEHLETEKKLHQKTLGDRLLFSFNRSIFPHLMALNALISLHIGVGSAIAHGSFIEGFIKSFLVIYAALHLLGLTGPLFNWIRSRFYFLSLAGKKKRGLIWNSIHTHYMKHRHYLTERFSHGSAQVFLQDAKHWPADAVPYSPYDAVPQHPQIHAMLHKINECETTASVLKHWHLRSPHAPLRQCELLALWINAD